jgi:hypothetical protein
MTAASVNINRANDATKGLLAIFIKHTEKICINSGKPGAWVDPALIPIELIFGLDNLLFGTAKLVRKLPTEKLRLDIDTAGTSNNDQSR